MIYLLEDDNSIRELVLYTLGQTGMKASGFERPSEFWKAMEAQYPDLILLDIMLPEEDGLSVLRKLRADSRTRKIPVMLLTAKDSEYDKVIGLDSGADDYLAKPFGMMELLARIRALLRRSDISAEQEDYVIGELSVSPAQHMVRVAGKEVVLTLKEFEVLCLLLKKRDTAISRDQLLNEVWGYSFGGESRTVDVHIRTLRAKLGSCGDLIETVRGVGYRISGGKK